MTSMSMSLQVLASSWSFGGMGSTIQWEGFRGRVWTHQMSRVPANPQWHSFRDALPALGANPWSS